jgi:hypothetical protein
MGYAEEVKNCGIKIGDIVEVTRAYNKGTDSGWSFNWPSTHDRIIGKSYKVIEISDCNFGIKLLTPYMFGGTKDDWCYAPYQVLKLTSGTQTVETDIVKPPIEDSNVISCSTCTNNHLPASDPTCDTYGQCPNYLRK